VGCRAFSCRSGAAESGEVNYPAGIKQHIFYLFLHPLGATALGREVEERQLQDRGGAGSRPPAKSVRFGGTGEARVLMLRFSAVGFLNGWRRNSALHHLPAEDEQIANFPDHPLACSCAASSTSSAPRPGAAVSGRGTGPPTIAVCSWRDFDHIPRARPANRRRPGRAQGRGVDAPAPGALPRPGKMAAVAASAHSTLPASSRRPRVPPPHDYLIRLRVDRARSDRQHHREWTLAPSPNECGLSDQSHMARHFKRVLGVSPGDLPDAARFPPLISIAQDRSHVPPQDRAKRPSPQTRVAAI